MNWISNILSGGAGKLIGEVRGIVDELHLSGEEKQKFNLDLETLLQARDSEVEETIRTELRAKERVLVAELQQGDNFTKRARPSLIYTGLAMIVFNYCVIPTIQLLLSKTVAPFVLPVEFWLAWGGVCSTWIIGRSAERRGSRSKVVNIITGGSPKLLTD